MTITIWCSRWQKHFQLTGFTADDSPVGWRCSHFLFANCGSLTFSLSVQTWMALGMRRAVFSFVIEQISFSRTVSYTQTHTHSLVPGPIQYCQHNKPGNTQRSGELTSIPVFPSGRCCYRNRSSSLRGRVVPAGGCPVAEHRNSLKHEGKHKTSMSEDTPSTLSKSRS